MTSRVGSVGDNTSGGMYAYRSSKAAANQVARNFAMDLKDRGVVVTVLHPGFVRSGLLEGNDGPDHVDPEEAAGKLWRNVVKVKGIEETGRFWHREGYELIW
jgi:NAD(P)-dependent dehydrogenase (short-subunit alcohol dehydrogenase family)